MVFFLTRVDTLFKKMYNKPENRNFGKGEKRI